MADQHPEVQLIGEYEVTVSNGAIFIDGIQATMPREDVDVISILTEYVLSGTGGEPVWEGTTVPPEAPARETYTPSLTGQHVIHELEAMQAIVRALNALSHPGARENVEAWLKSELAKSDG